MKQKNSTLIDFGTAVLTYNKWTRHDSDKVAPHFRKATPTDIQNLKKGDAIWLNQDPIHPNGKVYGFVKHKVTRKEGAGIHFDNGFTSNHDKIYFVDDERALAKLIDEDPKVTDVIGDSGRLATKLLTGTLR